MDILCFQQTAGQLQVGPEPWSACPPAPGSPPCSAHWGLWPPGKNTPWQMGKGGLVFTWMENHNTWGRTKM